MAFTQHERLSSLGQNSGVITDGALSLHAGGLDRPRYKHLEPGDPYYKTARAAYRIQESLTDADWLALFDGLATDWPRETRGRPSNHEHKSLTAYQRHRDGWSVDRIADELLYVTRDTARRTINEGRELFPAFRKRRWHVEMSQPSRRADQSSSSSTGIIHVAHQHPVPRPKSASLLRGVARGTGTATGTLTTGL